MNQNVFGMIFFSLIVGTAIFISAFLAPISTPPTVFEKPVTTDRATTCFTKKKVGQATNSETNIKVVQAILNQQTNNLVMEYSIKRANSQIDTIEIALHIFAKDRRATRYLATETMAITSDFDRNWKTNIGVSPNYKWLGDLKRQDNLYVIAELSSSFNKSNNLEPYFDETKATAVLLDKSKHY